MSYSHRSYLFVTTAVSALTFASQAFAQAPKASTIGLVDKDKVVTSYPKAQQAAEKLKKSEEHVHKLIEDSNKQYEEAKAAHKPPAELEGLQKRLQTQIDSEVKSIQGEAQTMETQLESEIDRAIKDEATARHCDTVLMKQAVLVGGTDITDGVVKRLNSGGAPAAKAK